jgi:hypothetical protein
MKKVLTIISVYLLSATFASAQDVNVAAKFDSAHILIGDQLHYTVTIDQPAGIRLTLFHPHDTLCSGIDILSGPKTDTVFNKNGRFRISESFIITSFDSGFYQVPPAFVEYRDASGTKRFYSDYARLIVSRTKIAPQDTTMKIFDIVGPYKAPVTFGEILPWILLVIAAAAIIWGVIILLRKLRKNEKVEEPDHIIEAAHQIAFRELEKLRNEKLWETGEIKQYYTRLTEIIRQYLENRYGIYSLELTTSETLEALVRSGFKKDEKYTSLKSILNSSDLVKFAKYKPEADENSSIFTNSWKFVEETMIKEVTPSVEPKTDGREVRQ